MIGSSKPRHFPEGKSLKQSGNGKKDLLPPEKVSRHTFWRRSRVQHPGLIGDISHLLASKTERITKKRP